VRFQGGIGTYEFAISICIVATLIAVLLLRIPNLQAESERMEVAQTVRNLRLSVLQAISEHVMHGQEYRIAEVASSNPIDLLETEPAGYMRGASSPTRGGEWTYDSARRQLAYRPLFPASFGGASELRWIYAPIVDTSGHAVGAHLVELN